MDTYNSDSEQKSMQTSMHKSMHYLGNVKISSAGVNLSLLDDAPFAGFPLKIYLETYPSYPGFDIVLVYTRDGFSTLTKRQFVYLPDKRRLSNPNNALYAVEIPPHELNTYDTFEWWIEAFDGNKISYYSNYGNNFRFRPRKIQFFSPHLEYAKIILPQECIINALPEPLVIEKEQKKEHEDKIVSHEVRVSIAVPGITDRYYPNNEDRFVAASIAIKAEAYSDIFSGVPDKEFLSFPLSFRSQKDGKFEYAWNLQPVLICNPKPGRYSYKIRFSSDGENWYWLGTQEGPLGGRDRAIIIK